MMTSLIQTESDSKKYDRYIRVKDIIKRRLKGKTDTILQILKNGFNCAL